MQLICVGPVIDLYGKFAALKFARMMEVYPGRVFSKPEFTALPPYIFSGADFALMPSRDEPFGLVAVEFGRKGALCIGARVGGLGQMPGWWFTIESTTTKHVIQQFKIACQGALASKPEVRAIMRARAAKQRFPVAQWVEDLEKLQSTAIEISQKQQSKTPRQSLFLPSGATTPTQSRWNTPARSRRTTPGHSRNVSRNGSRAPSPVRADSPPPPLPTGDLGSRLGPGQRKKLKRRSRGRSAGPVSAPVSDEDSSDEEVPRVSRRQSRLPVPSMPPSPMEIPSPLFPSSPKRSSRENKRVSSMSLNPQLLTTSPNASTSLINPSASDTRLAEDWLPDSRPNIYKQSNSTLLSLPAVIGETSDYKLQHVSPFFTDPKQEFTDQYSKKLEKLNGKTSEDQLCIEEYLVKSEKTWFGQMRAAQMGKSPMPSPSPAVSVNPFDRHSSPQGSSFEETQFEPTMANETEVVMDEFLLGPDYVAPKGLKHALRLRIGDWPLYSILLAFVRLPYQQYWRLALLTSLFHRVKSSQPTPIKSLFSPAPSAKRLTSCTPLPRYILLDHSYGGSYTVV